MVDDARFRAFLDATDAHERDWIAFCEFERAVHDVAQTATMVNSFDHAELASRELEALRPAVAEMLYRLLANLTMHDVLAAGAGIGYAIRYGIIEPRPDALDGVQTADALQALVARGCEAEEADRDMRTERS